jgi:hypothetical protein
MHTEHTLDAGMLLSSQEAALVVSLREGRMLALDVDARAMDAGLTATALDARVNAPAAAHLGAESLDAGALWLAKIDEDALEAIGVGAAPLDAASLEHLLLASEHSRREAKAFELMTLGRGAQA